MYVKLRGFHGNKQCASKQFGMSLQITYISAETHPKVPTQ